MRQLQHFFQTARCNQLLHKTVTFCTQSFCNENLHECSLYPHTFALKLLGNSSINSFELFSFGSNNILLHAGYNTFFKTARCNQMLHKTQKLFHYTLFCNENLHKCSSKYLHALVLKI